MYSIIVATGLVISSPSFSTELPPSEEVPSLVVLIVVDQLCNEYLDRFADHFNGFFARVRDEGRRFRDGDHRHALTVTAAGHAVIGTGRFPSHNGILSNQYYDVALGRDVRSASDPNAGPVDGKGGGSSACRLLSDGLGDWLCASNPQSKVIGVAGKPRAAIFLAGRHPTGAYWFDAIEGCFVTSSYYCDALPDWVKEFNDSDLSASYPDLWEASFSDPEVYTAAGCTADDQPGEGATGYPISGSFPHGLTSPDAQGRFGHLANSPFGDQLVLDFALRAVEAAELGTDEAPDLLALGLSATDRIGHVFGPHSWEIMEQILFLDEALEEFLTQLEEWLGAESILVVLSSDHGVCPLPERQQANGLPGQRIDVAQLSQRTTSILEATFGESAVEWLQLTSTGIVLDRAAAAEAGHDPEEVCQNLAQKLRQEDWIHAVRTRSDLEQPISADDVIGELLRNSFHPDRAGDLFLVTPPYDLSSRSAGTSHGTPHDYDRLVPIVFLGESIEPGLIPGRAYTTDIAPTIAEVLGVSIPDDIDGKPLSLQD